MWDKIKYIIKRPKLWIIIIGVALIPSIYNLGFLTSMWDPYGNLDELPVAVVNADETAQANGKTFTVGDDVVDTMSKDPQLNYKFVSATKAKQGLQSGDYYMIVTLPKDMSKKATTILSAHPQKIQLNYETSKGHSFVAAKMSDSAMEKLQQAVSTSITTAYTQAIFSQLDTLQSGVAAASEGSQQLADGTSELKNGSDKINTNLKRLATAGQDFATGATDLNTGMIQYTTGVSQLNNGASGLVRGTEAYTGGVSQLANGLSQLAAKNQTLQSGSQQLVAGTAAMSELSQGTSDLYTGLQQLAQATTLSDQQANDIQTLTDALPQLQSAINQLNAQVNQLDDQASIPDTTKVQQILADVVTNGQAIATANESKQAEMEAAVENTAAFQGLSVDQQAEIEQAMGQTSGDTAAEAQQIISDAQSIQQALSQLTAYDSTANASDLQAGIAQINATANTVLPSSQGALSELYQGMQTLHTQVNTQLIPGGEQLRDGTAQASQQLGVGTQALNEGVMRYTNSVGQLNVGTERLVDNSGALVSGATVLAEGAQQLNDKAPQLVAGTSQLAAGSEQISNGASQLATGSEQLKTGAESLSVGANELAERLALADEQLALTHVDDQNAELLGDPVATDTADADAVATNGVGLAPYMMAVSLMVVALSANVIFAKDIFGEGIETRKEWGKNRLLVNGFIATLAAVVLFLTIHLIGVAPRFEWRTLVMLVLTAWTLMALVTGLVGWHRRYGSFIAMIILVLQLGASAGTYPIELSPRFFQIIQPYLPMSYAVSGFRETLSINGEIGTQVLVLCIFLLAFMGVGLLIYRQPRLENEW